MEGCTLGVPVYWPAPCLDFSLFDFPVSVFSPTPHYPSVDPARVLNMPPVIYVPVGIHGYIRCPVDAEPPATVVKWNKDGRPLQVEKVLEPCMQDPMELHPLGVQFLPGTFPTPPKTLGKHRVTSPPPG